jgi:hypothetical protein
MLEKIRQVNNPLTIISSSFRYAERNGICSRRTSDGARLNNQQHAMINVNLTGIRACVFDANGTLFDVNSAAQRTQDALRDKWQQFAEVWRAKQLRLAAQPDGKARRFLAAHQRSPRLCFGYIEAAKRATS